MISDSELEAARQLTCPVVLISARGKPELTNSASIADDLSACPDDLYMISSISYVNLSPLILSTSFLKSSKTGQSALEHKSMAVSVLAFDQLAYVENLSAENLSAENLSAEKPSGNAKGNLAHKVRGIAALQKCGFSTARTATGLLYVPDSLVSFELNIINQIELEQYIVVLAACQEIISQQQITSNKESVSNLESLSNNHRKPLIRYNRTYATIDGERLGKGDDRYPV